MSGEVLFYIYFYNVDVMFESQKSTKLDAHICRKELVDTQWIYVNLIKAIQRRQFWKWILLIAHNLNLTMEPL